MCGKYQILTVAELVFVVMAASEIRQATYSDTGMCSTDAPYTVKNTNKRKCASECLHMASCEDFNHKNDNNECALFLHKPLFYDSILGCRGYKNEEVIACSKMGSAVPATISSYCCSIPFTLNGNLYYSCRDNGSSVGCIYGDREWRQCRQPADFQSKYVSTSTTALSANPAVIVPLLTINGWILMQRKVTGGLVSFNQNWPEYRDGFGLPTINDNYWLGLDKIYHLQQMGNVRLRIEIQRDTGLWYSVEYSSFSLGPQADKYRLSVSGFSGDVGDALGAPIHPARTGNGMQFTTPDQDNDNSPGHCDNGKDGWWFNWCTRSTLNRDANAVWNADNDQRVVDVVSTRMMVKLD